MFRQLGTKCAPLHSLVPQRERLSALDRFRAARVRILLCTDVASRGLDIAHVRSFYLVKKIQVNLNLKNAGGPSDQSQHAA